ncbi:MAG TPA: CHAD domain-containing protein, partial [Vicinamibacterales bacterium]|nr:CHAD domain-containing protein [Vicinamibacterales bacterium]
MSQPRYTREAVNVSHATTAVSTRLARRIEREARALRRHLRRARDGDVEGVHQARVASRRLREMLPLAGLAAPDEVRALTRVVRRVGRLFGPVREIDVSRAIWDAQARDGDWPPAVVAALERHAVAERAHSTQAIADAGLHVAGTEVR